MILIDLDSSPRKKLTNLPLLVTYICIWIQSVVNIRKSFCMVIWLLSNFGRYTNQSYHETKQSFNVNSGLNLLLFFIIFVSFFPIAFACLIDWENWLFFRLLPTVLEKGNCFSGTSKVWCWPLWMHAIIFTVYHLAWYLALTLFYFGFSVWSEKFHSCCTAQVSREI